MRYDTIIRQGRVFDGLNPGITADIGIRDGRVAALVPHLDAQADNVVDAVGLWVTPGFVDIHTHYDLEVEVSPGLPESVRHGVTTVVMGNCSLSVVCGQPDDIAHIFSRVETLPPELIAGWLRKAPVWQSPKAYIEHFRGLPLGANVACMLGHSALRVKIMGLERSLKGHATGGEIEEMRRLAEEALDAGCIGISVDMVHWHKVSGVYAGRALPSHHADYAEYAMLADVCRRRDAVFQVTPNPENAWSFINILRLAPGLWRAPLRLTVLSALDMDRVPWLWRVFPTTLFVCNRLLGCNIRFQTLAEPFTIYGDGHLTPLFEEFSAGARLNSCTTREERRALWRDPAFRKEFARSWMSGWTRTFHRDLDRMTIVSAPDEKLAGKTVGQAAVEAGAEPVQYFMDLLEQHDEALRWVATSANMREDVRHRLMRHPHILPGFSDAGAHGRNLAYFDSAVSVLRQSVAKGFLPPEKAISRVTFEPAAWFNLDAGRIRTGARADIVLLDPEALRRSAPAPVSIPDPALEGSTRMVNRDPDRAVRHVLVRGTMVVRNGEPLPVLGTQQLGVALPQLNPARSMQEALARHRNRVSDRLSLPHLESYWDIFLLKHRHPHNVALHCVAFVLMYAIPVLAAGLQDWRILLLWPLSQATGLMGHWLFEPSPVDPRDTVFSWRALFSLHRMFFAVLAGRYGQEQLRVEKHLGAE
ncbi:MAG: D-aminoacylase [Alphaproteobacteria bacterium]|nr:MAG: D-aminoacylase [Alphaproteobacteria bacterium]